MLCAQKEQKNNYEHETHALAFTCNNSWYRTECSISYVGRIS